MRLPHSFAKSHYSLPVISMMSALWDVGFKAYGKHPINEQIGLSYVAAVVNGNGGGFADINKKKDFVGRLGVSLPMCVSVGGSAYIGKAPPAGDTGNNVDKNRFGADLKMERRAQDYVPTLSSKLYAR